MKNGQTQKEYSLFALNIKQFLPAAQLLFLAQGELMQHWIDATQSNKVFQVYTKNKMYTNRAHGVFYGS